MKLYPTNIYVTFLHKENIPNTILYGWNEQMGNTLGSNTFKLISVYIDSNGYLDLLVEESIHHISINMLTDEFKTKVTKYLFEEKVLHLVKHK